MQARSGDRASCGWELLELLGLGAAGLLTSALGRTAETAPVGGGITLFLAGAVMTGRG